MQEVEQRMEQLPRGLGRGDIIKITTCFIFPHPVLLPEGEGTFYLNNGGWLSCPAGNNRLYK
jgi:hypothetical protein